MEPIHASPSGGNNNQSPVVSLTIEIGGGLKTIRGREAWALSELVSHGNVGVTPIERPAPRWAHYVHKLRRAGIHIETVDEKHSGAFAGTHARYVLRSPFRVIEIVRQSDNNKSTREDGSRGFARLPIPIST
jgi:hypothetical protein